MLLMPRVFSEGGLDTLWGTPFTGYGYDGEELMKTDVKETDKDYELVINMPGVKKEDVKAELKDGYLTVTATTSSSNEEKDKKGRYIRKERYSGTSSRSFYVGKDVDENDIKGKYENGTLKLTVPKKEAKKPEVEQKKLVNIEG